MSITGLAALLILGHIQQPPNSNSADSLSAGTIVFGPETFIRQIGTPKTERRSFTIEDFSGTFSMLIDNGQGGKNLASSAIIRLNDSEIFGTNDFNQQVFNLTESVILQKENLLEVELRGSPNSQLTIIILKSDPNPTINNPQADFRGTNIGDSVYFNWAPAERAKEYVRFRAYSLEGPWEEDARIPGSLTNSIDITAEAREKTLCYYLEARDEKENVVKSYKPICVPKYEKTSSHELSGLFNRIMPDVMCLNDSQFENATIMSLEDIRNFLIKNESFLRSVIPDVDGIKIDPVQIIYDASREFNVNPQVILTTLQKEHSAITSKVRLDREELRIIMGFDTQNPTTIKQQIRDAVAQFRRDFDKLTNGIPTVTGWLVGKTKKSEDPVSITPKSRLTALLFSYTPWVGQYWAELGGRNNIGGNGLFCAVWAKFDFPIPPQFLVLNLPSDVAATSLKLSWSLPIFPDPDIVSYKIFRSSQPNVTATSTLVALITDISQVSFTDTDLNPNTAYFYKIFVFDRDNLSASSNEVSATTLPFLKLSPWPMFRHDIRHTGQSEYVGAQTSNLKWRYKTNGSIDSSPSIGSDGTIYVGSTDKNLYALNPDGTLKWKYLTGGYMFSSPAIGPTETIYVGSQDSYIYAINPDGTLKWRYETGGDWINSSPAIGSDERIYVGAGDGYLYAINSNGSLEWKYKTGGFVHSSPAIDPRGVIYIGAIDGYLYAINLDGSLRWKYKTGLGSSPSIGSDGTIYVGSGDYHLYAINPNGTLKWKYKTDKQVWSTPAISLEGTIYMGSDDHYLYAINPNGSLKWKFGTNNNIMSSPSVGLDGTIYIGSEDTYIYAVTPDGTLKWKYGTRGNISNSSPAINSDGTVYIGSADYNIYAFGE